MIFGTKKLTELLERFRDGLRGDVKAGQDATTAKLDATAEKLDALQHSVSSHDLVIQDMLDSWEEWQDGLKGTAERLESAMRLQQRGELDEARRREGRLLSLAVGYHDQLHALRRAASGSPWEEQLDMAAEALDALRVECELQVIDAAGATYNGALHDVKGVAPAPSPEYDMRVADVYTCGYLHRGKVVRKAGVVVYQYRKQESGGADR